MSSANRSLVILGCTRRKRLTTTPVPALDLYEGGCVPQARQRLGQHPELRARVRILSSEYGLVEADRLLMPYDRLLTNARADELRPLLAEIVWREHRAVSGLERVLVVASPLYQSLVTDGLRTLTEAPQLFLVDDPGDWTAASGVLDRWGWL